MSYPGCAGRRPFPRMGMALFPLDWNRTGTWIHLVAFVVYATLILIVMHPTLVHWRSEKTRTWVGLALAVLFFLGLQAALASARKGHLLELILFRTYAPPGNGYFMTAVRVEDVMDTLRTYAAAMPNFPHDRPQTHPPAIFIYYAVSNFIFERLPGFNSWFAPIARSWAAPEQDWVQLPDPYVSSAFFSGLVQWLMACLAPLAFYAFLRRLSRHDPGRWFALWGAMLLPLLPSVSSFYSHWDVNYLLLGAGAWFFALRAQDRLHDPAARGVWAWLDWLWAGLLLSLLTWLSFGNAIYCVLVGGHLLWREVVTLRPPTGREWRLFGRFAAGAAILTAGVVVPWLLAFGGWQMNYFEMLAVGMQQHYLIVNNGRDPDIWRWMNLVDYALWVGPGVLFLGLVATIWLLARMRRYLFESSLAGMALIVWGVILVLDLSGTAWAEIGRLWIFLMPFPAIFALAYLRSYRFRAVLMVLLAVSAWAMGYALRAV